MRDEYKLSVEVNRSGVEKLFFMLCNILLFMFLITLLKGTFTDNDTLEKDSYYKPFTFSAKITEDSVIEVKEGILSGKIKTLVLESGGGNIRESLRVAKLIESHKIVTVVPKGKDCSSACGYMFMAGEQRILKGKLGLHASSFDGVGYEERDSKYRKDFAELRVRLVNFVESQGVSADYIHDSFLVPSYSMEYINEEQFNEYLK